MDTWMVIIVAALGALLLLEMGTRIARIIDTKRAKKKAKKAVDEIIKKLGEELAGK